MIEAQGVLALEEAAHVERAIISNEGLVVQRFRRGLQDPNFLKLSLDRKVSPRSTLYGVAGHATESAVEVGGVECDEALEHTTDEGQEGGYWVAKYPNSFGLPAGRSCPGETDFCKGCYAKNSERRDATFQLVTHNFELLERAGTVAGRVALLTSMVQASVDVFDSYNVPARDRIFRWHWDGDIDSDEQAAALGITIRKFPDLRNWIYTRSFVDPVDAVPYLVGIPNLALFLSTDQYNKEVAHKQVYKYGKQIRLAECAEDEVQAIELGLPGRRAVVCPENNGSKPLVGDNGRGACADCRLCLGKGSDIIFTTSHQRDKHNGQTILSLVPDDRKKHAKPSSNL